MAAVSVISKQKSSADSAYFFRKYRMVSTRSLSKREGPDRLIENMPSIRGDFWSWSMR
jgi:hypothetical protein